MTKTPPFFYVENYYRREIFAKSTLRHPPVQEWVAFALLMISFVVFFVLGYHVVATVSLDIITMVFFPLSLIAVLGTAWNFMHIIEMRDSASQDKDAKRYLEQKILPFRMFLSECDYYDQHRLKWLIDICAQELGKEDSVIASLRAIGGFIGKFIFPIAAFCAGVLVKDFDISILFPLALMAAIVLLVAFLSAHSLLPIYEWLFQQRRRSLVEMKACAEYLLAEVLSNQATP